VLILLLCSVFSLALLSSIMAGASSSAKMQPYEGQIKAVKVANVVYSQVPVKAQSSWREPAMLEKSL
jgi:hypothetical protein